MDIIYCGGGNKKFAQIAINTGWKFGARQDGHCHYPIFFADNDYKRPQPKKYLKFIEKYKPHMATVLDWQNLSQKNTIFSWAETIAPHVQKIIIIPKCYCLHLIPEKIANKQIVLGYSVPTRYGKTDIEPKLFGNRPVHLLGSNPLVQMDLIRKLNVSSLDTNFMQLKAKFGQIFENGRWIQDNGRNGDIYNLFEISCRNILAAFQNI